MRESVTLLPIKISPQTSDPDGTHVQGSGCKSLRESVMQQGTTIIGGGGGEIDVCEDGG